MNREKVEWAMTKLRWDPTNYWNLAVAIIDMIRRDLRVLLLLTDAEITRDTPLGSLTSSLQLENSCSRVTGSVLVQGHVVTLHPYYRINNCSITWTCVNFVRCGPCWVTLNTR